MAAEQLDLFASVRWPLKPCATGNAQRPDIDRYSDEALIVALASAGLTTAPDLAAETARRRLEAAVPVLENLCCRLTGYGADAIVPEQKAAIEAIAAIGGGSARAAIVRLIEARIVQGPTLGLALAMTAQLGGALRPPVLAGFLRSSDPGIRAAACRCVYRPAPELLVSLIDLLDDLHPAIADAAACALGRVGRKEGYPRLMQLLRAAPSPEVIEASAAIADDEVRVLLRRIALTAPDLADAVTVVLSD